MIRLYWLLCGVPWGFALGVWWTRRLFTRPKCVHCDQPLPHKRCDLR